MLNLKSITSISRVYETGTYPVRVLCNDNNEYICKHSSHTPANMLFTEYICASFIDIWKLKSPEFAFVKIAREHLPDEMISNTVQPRSFDVPCFGSRFYQYAKEVNESFLVMGESKKELGKIRNTKDLLKIALFDRWLGNDDRYWGNHNLLICPMAEGTFFMPFDHEKCFNGNAMNEDRPIAQQTEDETLLNSPICRLLLSNNEHLDEWIDTLQEDYYVCAQNCHKAIDEIFEETPLEWTIDLEAKKRIILSNIFTEEWINETFTTFRETCERFLR